MKVFLIAAICLCASRLLAQEPPLPAATETPAPSPSVRPQLDIPDIPMTVEHSSLGQAVEEQRLHLEWRKLKNRASLDPDVIAAKKSIDSARTDLEKRNLMRAYYKIFYARMQALATAPDVKTYLENQKNTSLRGLDQPQVRPAPTARPTATP